MKSSGNPPVKSKGDWHGKPHERPKAGPVPNPEFKNPPAREVPWTGTDSVK
jgi:hypothetical protein